MLKFEERILNKDLYMKLILLIILVVVKNKFRVLVDIGVVVFLISKKMYDNLFFCFKLFNNDIFFL